MKAKVAIATVKRAVALMAGISKGRGLMPSMAQGGESTPDEVRLLGLARCLSLLENFIPSEVKEEAQGRPTSKGL